MPTLAESLLNITLPGGWKVIERLTLPDGANGEKPSVGQFSRQYIAEKDGRRVFVKAMDMIALLSGAGLDNLATMQYTVAQFRFEREVLKICEDRKLNRIVRVLAADEYVDEGTAPPLNRVPFIVFELATRDARQIIDRDNVDSLQWALKLLHSTAVGVSQLHRSGITHQDIKLSNIFDFGDDLFKVGDLGRAIPRLNVLTNLCPHLDCSLAGDPGYAPPELIYDAAPSDWDVHWRGADCYLLGSLIVALFLGAGMTPLVQGKLAPEHRANGFIVGTAWSGSYQDVLVYVRSASEEVFRELEVALRWASAELRNEIVLLARNLCEPDPTLRGDPRSLRAGQGYDLERVVSRFSLLVIKSQFERKAAQ
jgi:eukaryotic-like serine/threonine-protein kinase